MKFVLISRDENLFEQARLGLHPSDELLCCAEWHDALDCCGGACMLFVDLVATLDEPNRIAGYERFAEAKMAHSTAAEVPVVLISPSQDYELDFMAGFPDFVRLHYQKPVDYRVFRRASTYV